MPLNLNIQRTLDQDRVKSIQDYQREKLSSLGTFLFLGDIIFGTDEFVSSPQDLSKLQNLIVLDGQHRLGAMRDIYHLQPDYLVHCTVLRLCPQFNAQDAFAMINLATPVPEYVMSTINNETKRKLLDDFKNLFERYFRSFISKAVHPRRPNVNLEHLLIRISDSNLLCTNFKSANTLLRYVQWINLKISSKDAKVRDIALQKADKKTVTPLFLSADVDMSWVDDRELLREYNTNILHFAPHERQIQQYNLTPAPLSNKRPRIPAAVRHACWNKEFGEAIVGKCPVCDCEITKLNFHAGHIIPHSKEGPDMVHNLRPLCATCNTSMGDEYMDVFIAKYFAKDVEPQLVSSLFQPYTNGNN